MELTSSIRKLICSLDSARHRRQTGLFKVCGNKAVVDTIGHFRVEYLAADYEWLNLNRGLLPAGCDTMQVTTRDLERMSGMQSPPDVIAVYRVPEREIDLEALKGKLVMALDSIQDPGNLGTIIRTADWFGVDTILCSHTTADCYGPKVVQATMGAISRVGVHYCDLAETLVELGKVMPVYGTFLDGENIYTKQLTPNGVIVMGNEGRGVSPQVAQIIGNRLLIPSFPPDVETSESLNVAIATAITLSEFRRR